MTQDQQLTGIHARVQYFQIITALLCEPEEGVTQNTELYSQLKQCIEMLDPDLGSLVDDLQKGAEKNITPLLVEYARLFIGPFKLPTPPYASCYLGSKELNNEITEWVRQFYETSGLEFDYTIMDLPDHIAVETEFLHYLLTQQLIAASENNPDHLTESKTQYKNFLENHYSIWVLILGQTVIMETSEPFYKNLFGLINKMIPVL